MMYKGELSFHLFMFRLRFRASFDFRYPLDVNNFSHRFHSAFKDVNTNVMDVRSLKGLVL